MKTLCLVDGSSFLFRAFHAVPPLSNAKGEPTNAIFGVSNMLRKLLNDYDTEYVAVVFDASGKTFRHELSEEYKANRVAMPDDLRAQIPTLHELIKVLGLPLIMESGIEADDVLGVLAKKAAEQGFKVVIATGDKDMAQLVNEQITLDNTMSDTRMNVQGVIAKFGVKPEQIIDYLALVGDNSDNIKGIPKVGAKTAAKWLAEYGTLDNLVAHAEEIKGKVGENLRANLDVLALAKQLTTIRVDLDLPYQIEELKRKPTDTAALKTMLTDLGFSSWLKTLSDDAPAAPTMERVKHYETILDEAHWQDWLNALQQAELFAIDTETTDLDYSKAKIVGLSFAIGDKAAYLPLAHNYINAPQQLSRETVLNQLKPLLEDESKAKLGQNLKYDAHVFANHSITLRGIKHDTMLASYVLNSTATKHNMDDLAKTYLNIKTTRYEQVAGKGAKQLNFSEVAIEEAANYAAEDAEITWLLHQTLQAKLAQQPELLTLYQELEMPLVNVLIRMEENGVLLDSAMLAQQSLELANEAIAVEQHAHDVAGHSFNLGSPKQIQDILYNQLKLPVIKKTPTGQPSTDESVLQELADDGHKLPKLILEYRSLSKLKSTYTDKLPQQIDNKTGRVHTSYHQAVTATGRLSSSEPNLQNIPIRSEAGRKIRLAFIALEGFKIVAADYSQIELRIMAHLSNDKGLIEAFNTGADIHKATAAEVFGVELDQVTNDLRRSAKAINFGLIYGMSAFGLSKQLGISNTQAQSYIDLYFTRYPDVKNYMDNIRDLARTQGYVETLFGRRLYLPDINHRNPNLRQYAERTAINAPMQGTAADIIKRAMLAVDTWLEPQNPSKMIMQVHDELVFEIPESELDSATQHIQQLMQNAASLTVPLVVDVGIGNNWDEAH